VSDVDSSRIIPPSLAHPVIGHPSGTYDPAVASTASVDRVRADMCPGALTVFEAADGGLARIRIPGGAVSADQLRALATASADVGDGRLELTSRGNLQVRALAPGAESELGERLAEAGLLPSATHERVRNIVASPLSGIDGDEPDVTDLVARLDRELCARPALAALPGRFLFALDDGRGDVATLGADVTLVARGDRATVGLFGVAREDAVAVLLATAEAFLAERDAQHSLAWRIDELSGGAHAVAERALGALAGVDVRMSTPPELPPTSAEPVGLVGQPDGRYALTVLAPLGRLTAGQAELLADHAGRRGLRVTPWRSVVVPDLTETSSAELATAADAIGLGVDETSRWYRVSACTGRPGCAKALADVQADARAAADNWPGRRVRWSGCERRCGRPLNTDVDIIATSKGYEVHG
jgi:precorrin-3B synthase